LRTGHEDGTRRLTAPKVTVRHGEAGRAAGCPSEGAATAIGKNASIAAYPRNPMQPILAESAAPWWDLDTLSS
jgi:hypothetical protein